MSSTPQGYQSPTTPRLQTLIQGKPVDPRLSPIAAERQRQQFVFIAAAELPQMQKLILMQVARCCEGGSSLYAALGKLAWNAGMTRRAARQAVHGDPRAPDATDRRAGLEGIGILEMRKRENSIDEFRPRRYTVRWDLVAAKTRKKWPGESKRPTRVRAQT